MRNNRKWMTVGCLMLIGVPTAHAADSLSVSTGANVSSGTYGTSTTTDIWSVPFTAAYQTKGWTFAVVIPYVSISGSGDVIPGTGPVTNDNPLGRGLNSLLGGSNSHSGSSKRSGSASGLGDIIASATYAVVTSADRSFALNLTGNLEFGTADANKGLGTGQNNYGLSLDTYKVFGKWTPFGGFGWVDYGSSAYIKLDNGLNANAGINYRIESSDSVGTYYYYRQRIATGGATQSQCTAYWNHKFSDSLRLQSYALGSTTDASPDWGVGTSIKYAF